MKHKPPPDPGRRLRREKTQLVKAETMRAKHAIQIQHILQNFRPLRTADNHFSADRLAADYGQTFANKFFQEIKSLYKARNDDDFTAYGLSDIVRRMNKVLRLRHSRLAERLLQGKSEAENSSGTGSSLPELHAFQLCHLYMVLSEMSKSEDQYLALNSRQIYHHTELKLTEIDSIIGLWIRGHGQHVISRMCHIDQARVRSLYRSLEEAYTAAPPPALNMQEFNISNKLWHWIVQNAKVVSIAPHTPEVYLLSKPEIEAKVVELELAFISASVKNKEVMYTRYTDKEIGDAYKKDYTKVAKLPFVTDPPKLYQAADEFIIPEVSAEDIPIDILPVDEPTPREKQPAVNDPLRENNTTGLNPLEKPPTDRELEEIKQMEMSDTMKALQRKTTAEYLCIIRNFRQPTEVES